MAVFNDFAFSERGTLNCSIITTATANLGTRTETLFAGVISSVRAFDSIEGPPARRVPMSSDMCPAKLMLGCGVLCVES